MEECVGQEKCSICLNDYKEPKILGNCQHYFCKICLEDYVDRLSSDDQFPCPVCRCDVILPEGGVNNLQSKSTSVVPRCEVCTTGEAGFKCQDCDQYFCKTCNKAHAGFRLFRNHVVVGWDEPVSPRENVDTDYRDVQDERDLCLCARKRTVDYLCTDCSKSVCYKCCFSDHNGHTLQDLQDEGVRQKIRDEVDSLNNDLKQHILKLEEFSNGLKTKENETTELFRTICGQIDDQVSKICSEVARIGENMKEKFRKMCGEYQKELGDTEQVMDTLKASVKTSSIVLEERSIVQKVERLDQLRQEVEDCRSRKMLIPDVPVMVFEAGKIEEDILTKQVGSTLIARQGKFEVSFNVNDIITKGRGYYSRDMICAGLTWNVCIERRSDDVVYIKLLPTDATMVSLGFEYVDYVIKLVNGQDESRSVKKLDRTKSKSLDKLRYNWSRLLNRCNGFVVDDRFTVEVKIEMEV